MSIIRRNQEFCLFRRVPERHTYTYMNWERDKVVQNGISSYGQLKETSNGIDIKINYFP